jgi:hypothetical protein
MCGRARLPSDVSAIKLLFSIPPDHERRGRVTRRRMPANWPSNHGIPSSVSGSIQPRPAAARAPPTADQACDIINTYRERTSLLRAVGLTAAMRTIVGIDARRQRTVKPRLRVRSPRAFVPDSALEGTGFEPSVPRQEKWSMPSSSDRTRVGRTLTLGGGAESSLEGRDIELSVWPKDIRTSPYDLCANRSDRRQSREGDR